MRKELQHHIPRWLAALFALLAAAGLTIGFAAQDVLHIYARSPTTQFYRTYLDTGSGLPIQESMSNLFFPVESRVNFPLPSHTVGLRVALGEETGSTISAIRICVERGLLITRCSEGAALRQLTAGVVDGEATVSGTELNLRAAGPRAGFIFDQRSLAVLRPTLDFRFLMVRCLFFVIAAAFFYCFLLVFFQPLLAWWTTDAIWLFLAAVALRALIYRFFSPGGVSDSDLFLRYLNFHAFSIPGIRGLTYPVFLTTFGKHQSALFVTQYFLGALGSVIVLLLLRSFKAASRWDLGWALVATSLPVFLAMESLILSESLSLFLLLAVLLAFRWVQRNGSNLASVVGLGTACALLLHTKPQFAFVPVLFAAVLMTPRVRALPRLLAFGSPLLASYILAAGLNFSYGNFHGISSTLGYSLFDHGQQGIDCTRKDPNPHVGFYCEAQAALAKDSAPYSYTAWVIYPSMRRLGEPFHSVTDSYAKVSLHLIAQHPRLYANTVMRSFAEFWTGQIPMVAGLFAGANSPSAQVIINAVSPAERLIRTFIAFLFFGAILTAVVRGIQLDRDAFLFCGTMVTIVLVSSAVQALLEYGRENPRFEIPTEPLLMMTIVYVATRLRAANF